MYLYSLKDALSYFRENAIESLRISRNRILRDSIANLYLISGLENVEALLAATSFPSKGTYLLNKVTISKKRIEVEILKILSQDNVKGFLGCID